MYKTAIRFRPAVTTNQAIGRGLLYVGAGPLALAGDGLFSMMSLDVQIKGSDFMSPSCPECGLDASAPVAYWCSRCRGKVHRRKGVPIFGFLFRLVRPLLGWRAMPQTPWLRRDGAAASG